MTLAQLRDTLAARGCAPTGTTEISAKCPAHEDHRASFSATETSGGTLLLTCHAGCNVNSICASLGIKVSDLFPAKPKTNGGREISDTYDYRDESGQLLFQAVRYVPKDFRARRPDGKGGWLWNLDVHRVIYRLPETKAAIERGETIYVAEGEKDCDALAGKGFAATCNVGGAGKWRPAYNSIFKGATVCIVADKDAPGRNHAADVAANLKPVAKTVRVIELPDRGQAVKDAYDFFSAGGTAADLNALCYAAPEWIPPTIPAEGDATATADIRGFIVRTLLSKDPPFQQRAKISDAVVAALCERGRLYYHAELRDFDSAMYFDATRKRLERVRGDAFLSFLSDWLSVNRADSLFRHVQAAVETAALSSPDTSGILPASFWHATPEAIFLSNGDGNLVRITARANSLPA
jgi:hypothetical protein